ncbi:DUF5987 family protein [Streptomyces sp. SM14]|uniref:DUF5987 family protein n=1 Tax=Streptomyces sp. SM14 TaxID=1736045 RepID=UPI0021560ABF|nr:DUF5987 family protein [Streptomyces sp. SM14]
MSDVDLTLEAYADTIVPGVRRWPGDLAVAGVSDTPGAVEAGALELMRWDATGIHGGLDDLAGLADAHASRHAEERGLELEPGVPAFVALPFEGRTALVAQLTSPGHPEREFWILLSLFANMAYDSAAHTHTADAIRAGHPGLLAMGITPPDPDGLWRFERSGYGRELARTHPGTTADGSPA